jgi:hypothetical protein
MTLVCHMCKVLKSRPNVDLRATTLVNSSLRVVPMKVTSPSQNVFSRREIKTLISWYISLHGNDNTRNGMIQNVTVLLLLFGMFRKTKPSSSAFSQPKLLNHRRKKNSLQGFEKQPNTSTSINCASRDSVALRVVSMGIRSVMKIRTRRSNC